MGLKDVKGMLVIQEPFICSLVCVVTFEVATWYLTVSLHTYSENRTESTLNINQFVLFLVRKVLPKLDDIFMILSNFKFSS